MASKAVKMGAFGGMHTAGIYSDMTVDGPEIGTLVAVVDRAKNLPNRRSMGKQDPYCAARLGKEAKKTDTDKRGGQTPRWDQELRFTVHDSPDYYTLKVSVFNDDKKTELIGETYVNLEEVVVPGGGQSDTWHGLNCKGKYAGEVRIELTYYDTRPKMEKPQTEKRREAAQSGDTQQQAPSLGGPRENTPVKRRPLPSNPTSASPSPLNSPAEQRAIQASQSGPRGYPTPPRQQYAANRANEYTPLNQRHSYHPDQRPQSSERRRPLPDTSSLASRPMSSTQGHPRFNRASEYDIHIPSINGFEDNDHNEHDQYDPASEGGFDMSYTAPKPYEVRPIDPLPQHHGRPQTYRDLPHSQSAPVIPSHHTSDAELGRRGHYSSHSEDHRPEQAPQHPDDFHQSNSLVMHQSYGQFNDFSYDKRSPHMNSYTEPHQTYDVRSHGRSMNSMQPTVEDEDDVPPPPPVHRSSAPNIMQHDQPKPPGYHENAPAPLNISRYREGSPRLGYELSPQSCQITNDHAPSPLSSDRRNTHPRSSMSPNMALPPSRPVSRDTMIPSPLRQESSVVPASLVAGYSGSGSDEVALTLCQDHRMSARGDLKDVPSYQSASSYETPGRQRHYSEPDYRTPPTYGTPPRPHPLSKQQTFPSTDSPAYYSHSSPQEPQRTSPYQDPAPMIKPRAISPAQTHSPMDNRSSRGPARSTPTRKSVSPRPPPSTADTGERRLSSVPFGPDDFDAFNPTVSRSPNAKTGEERRASNVEVNEKGQIVTFNGRTVDASDHLPIDSWAPEPERKGPQKERPVRERIGLKGARDIDAARQREKERKERDRIRNAVNASIGADESPSSMTPTSGYRFANSSPAGSGSMIHADPEPGSGGRNRLQKRDKRPLSAIMPPSHTSPSNIPMPDGRVLRERPNVPGYGGSPGYGAGSRHSGVGPPIPAKIPLQSGASLPSEDLSALSRELQSIDIGSGRPRPGARRRNGY